MGGARLRIAAVGAALAALIVAPPALGGSTGRMNAEQQPTSSFGWTLAPVELPEDQRTPGRLELEYRADAPEGAHPAALKEAVLALDRNLAIDLKGYPACSPPRNVEPPFDWRKCSSAIVGKGEAKVAIAFPESADVPAQSKVFADRSEALEATEHPCTGIPSHRPRG